MGSTRTEHGVEDGVIGEKGRGKASIFGEGEGGDGLRDKEEGGV